VQDGHGQFGLEGHEFLTQGPAGGGVQSREGLVEQQQHRVAGQGLAEGRPLALAAGNGPGALARQPGDAEHLQQFVHAPLAPRRDGHVGAHREMREQRIILEHEAQPPVAREHENPGARVHPHGGPQGHAALVGLLQPGGDAHEGGLARARGAHQGRQRAGLAAQLGAQLEVRQALAHVHGQRHG
jgi:hypothetical protein